MSFTVRNMDVLFLYIDLIEELIMETMVPALASGCKCRIIFIYAENLHIRKRNLSGPVSGRQLIVEIYRGCPCRESEFELPALVILYRTDYFPGNGNACLLGFRVQFYRYLFIAVENVFRKILFYEASIFW